MADDKLSETFNMENEGLEGHEDALSNLHIPSSPTLDDIARISLEVFADSMQKMADVPAPYRARTLEVSKQYLDLSKDAIHKKQDLAQKDKKLKLDEKKLSKKGSDSDTPKGSVSRLDLVKGRA